MNNDFVSLKTFRAFFAAVEFITAALYERSSSVPYMPSVKRRCVWPARAKQQHSTARRAHNRRYEQPSEGPATMSLRRPPTRVELKADDIIEYEEVSLLVTCSVGRKEERCGILFVPLHSSSLTFSSPHLLHLFT